MSTAEASPNVAMHEQMGAPPFRRLRVYAFDPSLDTQMETAVVNRATIKIPWEDNLGLGPIGEYLEVIDIDPASNCMYAPIDLNHPYVLAEDGIEPSEGNPQFHQQMVYAVAMTTIKSFETALGHTALWAAHDTVQGSKFIQRLRIYPHALRAANAYYSPTKKALLFGYFPASARPDRHLPRGLVFTCLSHDVVAHETTHALLDGMHRRFLQPSNADMLALHEAFADIVALFQHFTLPEVLRHQVAKTRGDLASENLLGQLAQQFGEATGRFGALRDALGAVNQKTGVWEPTKPDPSALSTVFEPHARGSLLVAAVFSAFVSIYKSRTADLLRIATSGTGVLPSGALHPDLVNRLASEAAKSARHVLYMCIRALDYCPAVDVTFGDYLRALITADCDLVPDDDLGYRIAFIEAFRRHGIYPRDVRTLSVDSLRWQPLASAYRELFRNAVPDDSEMQHILAQLLRSWDLTNNRERIFDTVESCRAKLQDWATTLLPGHAKELGLQSADAALPGLHAYAVAGVRPARRVGPDGQSRADLVVEIVQDRDEACSNSTPDDKRSFKFRGGCTLIIDLESRRIRYCIRKSMGSVTRLQRQRDYEAKTMLPSLETTYFRPPKDYVGEPFAFLHGLTGETEGLI